LYIEGNEINFIRFPVSNERATCKEWHEKMVYLLCLSKHEQGDGKFQMSSDDILTAYELLGNGSAIGDGKVG